MSIRTVPIDTTNRYYKATDEGKKVLKDVPYLLIAQKWEQFSLHPFDMWTAAAIMYDDPTGDFQSKIAIFLCNIIIEEDNNGWSWPAWEECLVKCLIDLGIDPKDF